MRANDSDFLELTSAAIGVTRIGDVTAYDRLGVPVVMAVRPLSRGYCVAQGKGLTLEQARISGLMEAAEAYHAENIESPLRYASYRELTDHGAIDPRSLPIVAGRQIADDDRCFWIEGQALSGAPRFVPFECVHTDYSLPNRAIAGTFLCSSNGLGAGRDLAGAKRHGLLEVIERDAEAIFIACDLWDDPSKRIALDAVDPGEASRLVDKLRCADVEPYAWNTSSALGVPAVYVTLVDHREPLHSPVKLTSGSGCRPTGEAALLAALLEAIQSRATVMAGTRDDLFYSHYQDVDIELVTAKLGRLTSGCPQGAMLPGGEDDFDGLSRRVGEVLGTEIVVVDLSKGIEDLHVARVIAPGLEGVPGHSLYAPGSRARAASAK
jgi:ribosomal protein S12 methylthiotransferase accessory factor